MFFFFSLSIVAQRFCYKEDKKHSGVDDSRTCRAAFYKRRHDTIVYRPRYVAVELVFMSEGQELPDLAVSPVSLLSWLCAASCFLNL